MAWEVKNLEVKTMMQNSGDRRDELGSLKPQKRHPALVPLSHDHHEGLIAAQRLKRAAPAYRDCDDATASIILLWERELEFHFRQEEEHLFGLETGDDLAALIRRALDEHAEMRTMVDECRAGAADEELIRRLGSMLERHIRFEERELFPALQEHLSGEALERIGAAILEERRSGGPVRGCVLSR